jgi:hypothetical protein
VTDQPKFKVGDRVLVPFNGGIGVIKEAHDGIFGGHEYIVECRWGWKMAIHETNLDHATILDDIVLESERD